MKDLATVFGGSGFLGRHVVGALAREGHRVRVAVRRPALAYRLPMMGDVGQIEIVQANLRDEDSIARALDEAEVCVNCVGILFETGRQKFEDLHVEGAKRVAQVCAASGVGNLIHVSAIGANADSPSAYARTKALGEAAVRAAYPASTLVRPSVVFGPEDDFFNRFAEMATWAPALPLVGGGNTLFQPVFVSDVAQAVSAALATAEAAGQTYELGGPTVYSFEDLMRLMLSVIDRKRALVSVSFGLAGFLGKLGEMMARTGLVVPPLTADQVELLRADNVVSNGSLGLTDLGVTPSAIEPILPTYLYRFRRRGQYAEELRAAVATGAV
ncbi:MAG TPA: complex I NDUFA9 subunit family protein [Caulobacteraceae bacterium]|nr:complex I NDUFA9 subunit family protein [Caulobacteraceae bacterium]